MPTVFLSYSTKDHHFAELAGIKLAEAGVNVWRDQGQLRAGSDWRGGLERGISESIAVLVALSESSAESSYVTFEWAYGPNSKAARFILAWNPFNISISRCQARCPGIS